MKTLRPYQEDAVRAFVNTPDGHGTLKMHPGSGKTLLGVEIYRRLSPIRAIVVTITIDLKDQWLKVFQEQGIEPPRIETYAYASKRADELNGQYDFWIMDEVHHVTEAPVFGRLLEPAFNAKFALGLSATPPEDPENIALRVMPIVYERTYQQGLDEGYAAPFKVIPVESRLTADEEKSYRELTSMIREMIAMYGEMYQNRPWMGPRYPPLQGEPPEPEPRLWGAQVTHARRQLTAMAADKFAKLESLATRLLRLDSTLPADELEDTPTRILVWSEYVGALEIARDVLNRNGRIAELVTGKTPKKERRRLLTEAWGHEFPILLVAKIGEEGIDYPECDVGIIIAGAKTSRQNIQRLGRLLRPLPGKEAKLYAIYAAGTTDIKILPLLQEVAG